MIAVALFAILSAIVEGSFFTITELNLVRLQKVRKFSLLTILPIIRYTCLENQQLMLYCLRAGRANRFHCGHREAVAFKAMAGAVRQRPNRLHCLRLKSRGQLFASIAASLYR